MCIDIIEIWVGIANWQISSIFNSYLPATRPYFHFRVISTDFHLACALMLWRSGLGLFMGKIRQVLPELSARDTFILAFPGDNFSKYKWIFTKLGICIDIVKIWFGIGH